MIRTPSPDGLIVDEPVPRKPNDRPPVTIAPTPSLEASPITSRIASPPPPPLPRPRACGAGKCRCHQRTTVVEPSPLMGTVMIAEPPASVYAIQ